MSPAADRFDAGAERFRAHAAAGAPPASLDGAEVTERLTAIRQSRTRRTRRTVDLTAAQHRGLDIWQREAADRLGLARVTGQEVLSALIDQLLTDRQLSARILRTIQARR
ncbi:hypothetical protein BMW24_011155 [Mycobacterium heckeshornense]|uniref:Uncharacterized protein n=1 Tax=Mycobacterium heckeshornense TaxID=110505 RepID=A0A2G8B9Y6_9MYCO|nr:hypothetical protein [Mycobacterium heckeshornense]KMV21143.1 hypothetical protein ACT16_18330 [Mycobacterium heckeshornense]MCV7033012.1 hypothetical protein [Mycobacterium heckeshornense]PIJ34570.1 hypothetical protein BMW24_011155 [Mycobacterium heckeshornense]BCO36884.1 hypothetical protein MHEC_33170 [Mycobacterium heckeshornense]BCQ09773.1 hypothetical protein JMUB5695_03223 [Mycobacterium heckeshornense]